MRSMDVTRPMFLASMTPQYLRVDESERRTFNYQSPRWEEDLSASQSSDNPRANKETPNWPRLVNSLKNQQAKETYER